MEALMAAVTVLTAMVTPAILISACSGLILSTSHRLWRVTDRVRYLSDELKEITRGETKTEHRKERCQAIFSQLDRLTARARNFAARNRRFLRDARHLRRHEHRHRNRRRIGSALRLAARRHRTRGRVPVILRQHLLDLRIAFVLDYDKYGDEFRLASGAASRARRIRRLRRTIAPFRKITFFCNRRN